MSIGLKGAVITACRRLSCEIKSGYARAFNHDTTKSPGIHAEFAAWIARHEPDHDQLKAQKFETMRFDYKPLLSVIIPIYKLPRIVLLATLNCLLEQTYSNWEACIVWADSEDIAGFNWLQEMTRNEKRFKIKLLDHNAGISNNTNAALELAEGEYIALLDHDDILAPWAFYEAIKLLQSSQEIDFIYSDKDSITADGQTRLNALFKPEWSPEILHSVNYLTHLNIMRTSLVREIGGWNPETDGAQDWDIFFRITERTQHIARIPSILYHWRILPTSTATGLQAKPYAAKGQLVAQQNHFKRRGLPATVMATPEGSFHVKWPIRQHSTDVVVCQTGSSQQLMRILNVLWAGKQEIIRKLYLLHTIQLTDALKSLEHAWGDRLILVSCDVVDWLNGFKIVAASNDNQTAVLIDGSVTNISDDLVQELGGWVTHHPEIAWSSAIALDMEDTVYEAGRVVAEDYRSAPMFRGSRLFSSGWFGAAFWYRNARAASPYAVAVNAKDITATLSQLGVDEVQRRDFCKFCIALSSNGRRGLINPFARVYFDRSPETRWPNDGRLYHGDPYFNPAFNQVSPLKLLC
jgi:glycosyltransferase involved in cell wall biosynthesis